jgi:2Fe-2S ferredoxin
VIEIIFSKGHREKIQVKKGTLLMNALTQADVPVASSCHGDGVCAKCRIKIVSGMEHLSPENETEKFLRERFSLSANERISCQASVLGSIQVDASYW